MGKDRVRSNGGRVRDVFKTESVLYLAVWITEISCLFKGPPCRESLTKELFR